MLCLTVGPYFLYEIRYNRYKYVIRIDVLLYNMTQVNRI